MPPDLRPLKRIHQIAREIRVGIQQDDLELVSQGAELLGPAVEDWRACHAELPVSAGEAAELALQTRQVLNECEEMLLKAMGRIEAERKRLRQGRRTLEARKSRPIVGSQFDTTIG